eukprot:1584322-Prymnesium_polylepis.2
MGAYSTAAKILAWARLRITSRQTSSHTISVERRMGTRCTRFTSSPTASNQKVPSIAPKSPSRTAQ